MFRLSCDLATVPCKITIKAFIFQDCALIHLRLHLSLCPLLGKQKKKTAILLDAQGKSGKCKLLLQYVTTIVVAIN